MNISNVGNLNFKMLLQINKGKVFLLIITFGALIACEQGGVSPELKGIFAASDTAIQEGTAIIFTNQSTNEPTIWEWSFEGGTPLSSSAQNPFVVYSETGKYDVSLRVSKGENSDFIQKSEFIEVYNSIIDDRDGQEYRIVKIGNQTWFAENIRTTQDRDGNTINRNCMNNDEDCANGGLYTHETANKICPNGWHLTTDQDWKTLESNLGMTNTELNAISYRGSIANQMLEGGSTNLNIKLSGYRLDDVDHGIHYQTNNTYFWSENREYIRGFSSSEDGVYRAGIGPSTTVFWMNCRCVKDN